VEILSNGNLARKIRSICAGSGPRKCAVAFWGKEMATLLFPQGSAGVDIVLDVAMGGTTKDALKALGVPSAKNVWACDGLHTKLYIGETGAVIASANASVNALGRDFNGGKLQELGVWLDAKADRKAYKQACAEFEAFKKRSHVANVADLAKAPEHGPRHMSWAGTSQKTNSLLDIVGANPQDFGNVLFVFGDQMAGVDERNAADAAHESYLEEQEAVSSLPPSAQPRRSLVAYCKDGENRNFDNAALVAMYWGRGDRFEIYAYTDLVKLRVKNGHKIDFAYFGIRDWRKFKNQLGIGVLGTVGEVSKTDRRHAKALASAEAPSDRWQEYSASELADALAML